MNEVKAIAPAKINLTLDVTGKRGDGYHTVKMIMQTVSLYDEIIVRETDGKITLSCNFYYVPLDERNIAFKAAVSFFNEANIKTKGAHINLKKSIPSQAGLAGGSADAAATLVALNKLYDTRFGIEKLCEMGAKLGADIPFCLLGGTMLCEGIGEILTPLPPMPSCNIVIARPGKGASTPKIYKLYDETKSGVHPDTDMCIAALGNGNIKGVADSLYNVFEDVTATLIPEISKIKNKLLGDGALNAVMTGSGSAVYGIFDDDVKAKQCYTNMKKIYNDVFIVNPVNYGAY